MPKFYGSILNRLQENSTGVTPVVGMGVTELCYTDRHPYEVIEVKDAKHIVVREMDYKRTDNCGMSEHQEYEYTSKPDGEIYHLVLRNGRWRNYVWEEIYNHDDKTYTKKLTRKLGCNGWYIGKAERYYDFSF